MTAVQQVAVPSVETRTSPLADVLLVVPVLNEQEGLGTVLQQAAALGLDTLVIDGGSTDASRDVARASGVEVLDVRRGKGRAWLDFLSSVAYESWHYVAMVDADGSYDLSALPRLLSVEADMVVAVRERAPGSTAKHRLLGSTALTIAASLLTLRRCPDVLSGFRLMRSDRLRNVSFEAEEFGLEAELTIGFLRRGYRVAWVPAGYLPRCGRSKLRPVADGIDILRTMLVTRFRRL